MTTVTKKATAKKATTKKAPILIPDLPNNPLAFEIFDLTSKQKTKAKKIEVLKKYRNDSLVSLFIWNFDETVISLLPDGEVPYSGYADQTSYSGTLSTKIDEATRSMYEKGSFSMGVSDTQARTTIRREAKNFYHFVKGGNQNLTSIRRESMFINLLEGLHPLEAEIICLVKDKKLFDKYKITKDVVSEAYPDINWGGRS
jgi:hypothetical protein